MKIFFKINPIVIISVFLILFFLMFIPNILTFSIKFLIFTEFVTLFLYSWFFSIVTVINKSYNYISKFSYFFFVINLILSWLCFSLILFLFSYYLLPVLNHVQITDMKEFDHYFNLYLSPFILIIIYLILISFFLFFITAKSIISIEREKKVSVDEYFSTALILMFFPFGFFHIQQRINIISKKIFNEG